MSDLSVHVIGEIQGSRPVGQVDHIALGGEDVHAVLCDIKTELFGDRMNIAGFLMPVQNLSQPGYLFFVAAGVTAA